MVTLAIIVLAIVVLLILLFLGDFKLEFRINKHDTHENPVETTRMDLDKLSNTELNIMRLVADGKSNQEIANQLFISVHTVKKHISHIFKKLNLSSRSETRKYKDLING